MSPPHTADRIGTEPIELRPKRLGAPARLGLVALAATLVAGLAVARAIEPDSRGYGTHEQLGLPPCSFRWLTGTPCPSCGMTTSWAYLVRGDFLRSVQANPGGALLGLVAAVLVPWLLASALASRPWGVSRPQHFLIAAIVVVVGLSVTGWVVRYFLFGGQG